MKFFIALATVFALSFGTAAFADEDHNLSDEQLQMIDDLLADLRCEVTGDIEVEDGEIELDDVICAGGQFDVELNEELHIIGARPE